MKIKNYLVIAAASLGLSLIYSNQVQADEMPPTNQQSVNNNLSQTDINELDKYVSVENNTFVLNVPENSNISSEKVQMARQEIESVNNSIKNNNLLKEKYIFLICRKFVFFYIFLCFGDRIILCVRMNSSLK